MQIHLGESGRNQGAVISGRPIPDAEEAQAGAGHTSPQRMARRQATGPGRLWGQGQTAAVLVVFAELRMGVGQIQVCGQPGRELVTGFELDAPASRGAADRGGAIVTVPNGFIVEIELPQRCRQIPAAPQARARADLFAHSRG